MAQWMGIHLPMQETGVLSQVQEDHRWHRATKPPATTPEPVLEPAWSRARAAATRPAPEALLRRKRSRSNEKPVHCKQK